MALVTLTEAACEKAQKLVAASERPGDALRIRVKDGGCSGMRYELLFDGEALDGDEESHQGGLRLLIDANSAQYLRGSTVDYSDGLNESGFKIDNPLADETCGCGESFGV